MLQGDQLTGVKEIGGPGDVGGERQQDSGRAQTSGREKREQSAVLMCQEPEVVTGGVVHPGTAAAVMCSSFSYRRMALSW